MKQALQRQQNYTSSLFDLTSSGPLIILRCYCSTSWRLVKVWCAIDKFQMVLCSSDYMPHSLYFHQFDRDIFCLFKLSHIFAETIVVQPEFGDFLRWQGLLLSWTASVFKWGRVSCIWGRDLVKCMQNLIICDHYVSATEYMKVL